MGARSFESNPLAYNAHYHFELAIEAGCNAYIAPWASSKQALEILPVRFR